MPLRYASLFGREYKEVLRQKPNLFSFLTDRGVSYYDEFSSFSNTIFRYFIKKYNRISGDVFPSVFKELLHNKNNLFNVSLNKIDFLSHQHGSFSKKTLSYCRKIDRFCEKVSNYLASNFDEYNLLIFSDHGLTSVDNIFNLVKYLKQLPIKQGKDYDMFIDSICARFWPKTDSVKKFLIDHLNKIECGFIMQESDYTQNHLPFDKESKRKYGELIFIVRNHTLILPNYWQGRVPVKGMHSYFEEDDSNLSGFFLFDTSDKQKKILKSNADYWDIAPSIIRCLDEEIPKFMTGASIV